MEVFTKSETGNYREINQDRIKVLQNDNFILGILCDGMGGHAKGEIASATAINTFERCFYEFNTPKNNPEQVSKWYSRVLKKIVLAMNLVARTSDGSPDMGTTLVSFLKFHNSDNIYIYNIGDSRAYVYNNILKQITVDQNKWNYLVKNENYSEQRAKLVPGAMHLMSSLGPNKKRAAEFFFINNVAIKYILLTSDGIHDFLEKPVMERIFFEKSSLEEKGQKLIKLALEAGSDDNVSVVLVQVKD
ncbi:protein phosphatase 2C domain-containing protein [Mycoplasma iguanae]|uniref:Protein phosphatase 2C domain-containing protein n=1 Tax=Mycoplasma iguanae TaxID=292461 RepID=A0ABY5RC22_9MOLU|nr:protein phosphatase 2C domain-containing protein [Mycoplasma iguanae]UVD81760.1 protein phosphatase 2C domain-containing protein [Mycoplasma iguanae]